MEKIKTELENAGYDFAVAIATQAEIDAKAACGQLALVEEEQKIALTFTRDWDKISPQ